MEPPAGGGVKNDGTRRGRGDRRGAKSSTLYKKTGYGPELSRKAFFLESFGL